MSERDMEKEILYEVVQDEEIRKMIINILFAESNLYEIHSVHTEDLSKTGSSCGKLRVVVTFLLSLPVDRFVMYAIVSDELKACFD